MTMLAAAPTLHDRLNTARLTVAALERASGAAALDSQPVDHTAINAARAEVESLEQAEHEAHRRAAHADANLRAAERSQAAQGAREALSAYSAAVTRGEAATVALAGELANIDTAAATLRKCFLVMARGLPINLEAAEMRRTLSRLVIGELVKVGSPQGYGDFKWPSVPRDQVWLEHVEKYIQPAVLAAIEKEEIL